MFATQFGPNLGTYVSENLYRSGPPCMSCPEDLQRASFPLDCIVCERPLSYDGTFSPIVCPHRILSPGGRGTSLDEVTLRVQFFAS